MSHVLFCNYIGFDGTNGDIPVLVGALASPVSPRTRIIQLRARKGAADSTEPARESPRPRYSPANAYTIFWTRAESSVFSVPAPCTHSLGQGRFVPDKWSIPLPTFGFYAIRWA